MAEEKSKPAATKSSTKASAAPKKSPTKTSTAKKAPAAKTAAAKPAAARKPAARKTAAAAPGAEERYRMVEVAAYFLAERNGFAGDPSAYWIAAEQQITRMLSK